MLTLKVEAMAGEDVRTILAEMALVAARTGCMVCSNLNGVHAMVKPGADPREAWRQWDAEITGKRPYKIFCAQPVEMPAAWEDLRGAAPNATGDLSSEAFVRKMRDEEWDRGAGVKP